MRLPLPRLYVKGEVRFLLPCSNVKRGGGGGSCYRTRGVGGVAGAAAALSLERRGEDVLVLTWFPLLLSSLLSLFLLPYPRAHSITGSAVVMRGIE